MVLLKPVTNQLQDKHGRAEDWLRREEEEEEEEESSLSLHMLSATLAKGVWCCWECGGRERGSGARSGWAFDSIPLPPSSGDHTLFVLYFLHHMTCRFFLFKHFSSPRSLLSLCERRSLPGRKGETAVAVPSSSPLTEELCKQEIQIRCR